MYLLFLERKNFDKGPFYIYESLPKAVKFFFSFLYQQEDIMRTIMISFDIRTSLLIQLLNSFYQ